ncbi:MAG: hypothetical protein WA063_03000 [Minisyncoccia bacterium]
MAEIAKERVRSRPNPDGKEKIKLADNDVFLVYSNEESPFSDNKEMHISPAGDPPKGRPYSLERGMGIATLIVGIILIAIGYEK